MEFDGEFTGYIRSVRGKIAEALRVVFQTVGSCGENTFKVQGRQNIRKLMLNFPQMFGKNKQNLENFIVDAKKTLECIRFEVSSQSY